MNGYLGPPNRQQQNRCLRASEEHQQTTVRKRRKKQAVEGNEYIKFSTPKFTNQDIHLQQRPSSITPKVTRKNKRMSAKESYNTQFNITNSFFFLVMKFTQFKRWWTKLTNPMTKLPIHLYFFCERRVVNSWHPTFWMQYRHLTFCGRTVIYKLKVK